MGPPPTDEVRLATAADVAELLDLWSEVYDEDSGDTDRPSPWRAHARAWFLRVVDEPAGARFPVVEIEGRLVATAIGTLELGVPNPHCPRGRTVRLANVVTLPEHRGRGFATGLVHDVIGWARSIDADRVDLSATAAAQRIYARAGFRPTTAPRMKLVL